MQEFADKLYEQMENRIGQIKQQELQLLKQLPQCIGVCQETLGELRGYFDKHPFSNSKQEILFFKQTKPRFYSQFIYYVTISQIEIYRPIGSDKAQFEYLEGQLDRLKHFFDSNLDFYQYYRGGATHFDELYFVRGKYDLHLFPDDLALSIDPVFCTLQSYKLSRLFANEELRIYLNAAISDLMTADSPKKIVMEKKMQWTGSKVSLVELIYALQGSGVLNNATADIKQLAAFFEAVFQVKLGNVYNVFNEMRIRKKNRSSFLDLLKDRLIQRMDEADEG